MNKNDCGLECSEPQGGAAICVPTDKTNFYYVGVTGCLLTGSRQTLCVDNVAITEYRNAEGDIIAGEPPKEVHPKFKVIAACDMPGGGAAVLETLTEIVGFQYNPATEQMVITYRDENGTLNTLSTDIEFPAPNHPPVVLTSSDASVTITPDASDPDGHTFNLTVAHPPITCADVTGLFVNNLIQPGDVAGQLAFDVNGDCGILADVPPCACQDNTAQGTASGALSAADLDALCPVSPPQLEVVTFEAMSQSYAGSNVIDGLGNGIDAFPHSSQPMTVAAGDVLMVSLTYGLASEFTFDANGWMPDAAIAGNIPFNATLLESDGTGNLPGEGPRMYTRTWLIEVQGTGTLTIDATATAEGDPAGASAMIVDRVNNTDPAALGAAKIVQSASVETTNGDDANPFSVCLPNAMVDGQSKPYQVTLTRHVDIEINGAAGFDFAAAALAQLNVADGDTVGLNPGQCNAVALSGVGDPGQTCGGGKVTQNSAFATGGFPFPDWDKTTVYEFAPAEIPGQPGTGDSIVVTVQASALNIQTCPECTQSVCDWTFTGTGVDALLMPGSQYLIEYLIDGAVASSFTLQNPGAAAATTTVPGANLAGTKGVVPIGGNCPIGAQVRVTCLNHVAGSTIDLGDFTAITNITGAQ